MIPKPGLHSLSLLCPPHRFSFYGMKTILPLYLTGILAFSQSRAITIIHAFNFGAYAFTLLGGVLSDGVWGKFWTILWLSLVYCLGLVSLSVTALPLMQSRAATLLGLWLVALGTGGIKPCVSAFGGDQFPESEGRATVAALAFYFSAFYFAINAGSVLSMFITPILRQNVHCFGEDSCYPAAFGLPALLMLVATVILVLGSHMYVKKPPSGDGTLKILRVLVARLKTFLFGTSMSSELARESSDSQFQSDLRVFKNILVVFAPISLFWALYDQQGSRWTYQALMMNGRLTDTIFIKPEQMGIFNALLILGLIPAFERIFYPVLASKCNIHLGPQARMCWGMVLAGASFVAAAVIQLAIEACPEEALAIDERSGMLFCSSPSGIGCVHVLWQVPQYFLLTCGEIMLSVTGLEFAYSQAPVRMKALCSSAWLLTVAVGNLIVVFVNEAFDPVGWIVGQDRPRLLGDFLFWAGIVLLGALCLARLPVFHLQ
jgi:solute carrier family 15 oligopeptide transporter 1